MAKNANKAERRKAKDSLGSPEGQSAVKKGAMSGKEEAGGNLELKMVGALENTVQTQTEENSQPEFQAFLTNFSDELMAKFNSMKAENEAAMEVGFGRFKDELNPEAMADKVAGIVSAQMSKKFEEFSGCITEMRAKMNTNFSNFEKDLAYVRNQTDSNHRRTVQLENVVSDLQKQNLNLQNQVKELQGKGVSASSSSVQVNFGCDPTDPTLDLNLVKAREGELIMVVKKGVTNPGFDLSTMDMNRIVSEVADLGGDKDVLQKDDIEYIKPLLPNATQKAQGLRPRLIVRMKNASKARAVAATIRKRVREARQDGGAQLHRNGELQVFLNQSPQMRARDILRGKRIQELKAHNKTYAFGFGGMLLVDGIPYNCNDVYQPHA